MLYLAYLSTNVPYESEDILVGVFTTQRKAERAAQNYLDYCREQWLDKRSTTSVIPVHPNQVLVRMATLPE